MSNEYPPYCPIPFYTFLNYPISCGKTTFNSFNHASPCPPQFWISYMLFYPNVCVCLYFLEKVWNFLLHFRLLYRQFSLNFKQFDFERKYHFSAFIESKFIWNQQFMHFLNVLGVNQCCSGLGDACLIIVNSSCANHAKSLKFDSYIKSSFSLIVCFILKFCKAYTVKEHCGLFIFCWIVNSCTFGDKACCNLCYAILTLIQIWLFSSTYFLPFYLVTNVIGW